MNIRKLLILLWLACLSVCAGAQVSVPTTDTHWYFSPYNWQSGSTGSLQANNVMSGNTYAQTINPGAYAILNWTTTSSTPTCSLALDLTLNNLNSIGTGYWPHVHVQVDGGAVQDFQVAASLTIAVPQASGAHSMRITYAAGYEGPQGPDWWVTPNSSIRLVSATLDSGATLTGYTPAAHTLLVFGDDMALGYQVNQGTSDPVNNITILGTIFEGNTLNNITGSGYLTTPSAGQTVER